MENTCTQCKATLLETAKFCHQCGATTTPGSTLPPSSPPQGADLPRNIACALAYFLGLLSAVVLLVLEPYKRDSEIRFHAYQSICLCVAWILLNMVGGFLYLGLFFIWLLQPAVNVAFFILWIVLMVKAYQGERWKLPILGEIAEQQARRNE